MRRVSENPNDPHRYDDMLNMEHHVSGTHRHMSMAKRAAQFAPFAALEGYEASIIETARRSQPRIELSEGEKEELSEKVTGLQKIIRTCPLVSVTYFEEDETKSGGQYLTIEKKAVRLDLYNRQILFEDKSIVNLDDIIAMHIPALENEEE